MIIISIIITAPYSTVLKRKFQTIAFSTTILNILLCKIQWIHKVLFLKQVPINLKLNLMSKIHCLKSTRAWLSWILNVIKSTGNKSFYLSLIYNESYK